MTTEPPKVSHATEIAVAVALFGALAGILYWYFRSRPETTEGTNQNDLEHGTPTSEREETEDD